MPPYAMTCRIRILSLGASARLCYWRIIFREVARKGTARENIFPEDRPQAGRTEHRVLWQDLLTKSPQVGEEKENMGRSNDGVQRQYISPYKGTS